jgi:hypothetical protein
MSTSFLRTLLFFILVFFSVNGYGQGEADSVCVTNTGSKYHLRHCHYLRSSSIRILRSDAIKQGYTPCTVCKPPTSEDDANTSPAASQQCIAKTKAGARCKRTTTASNGRCWQHQ